MRCGRGRFWYVRSDVSMLTFGCDSCRMVFETLISVRRFFASIIEYCRQNAASNYYRRDERLPMVFADAC